MYGILLTLHVVVCVLVIAVVLVQSGKGAGLSNIFGGGGGDALFSAPSGSMFLRKMTTGFAVAFFMTSLLLTYLSARQGLSSITRRMMQQMPAAAQPAELPVPQTPAAPAAEPSAN